MRLAHVLSNKNFITHYFTTTYMIFYLLFAVF